MPNISLHQLKARALGGVLTPNVTTPRYRQPLIKPMLMKVCNKHGPWKLFWDKCESCITESKD